MSAKKLSEDKERYKYKKVLTENGIPVPGLWQRLKKYYVYVSVIKNGRIVPTFIPLKTRTLQKAIDECQKLQAYWAKERNNFKIHEITEDALKEEIRLLSNAFASELLDLKEEKPSVYQNYVIDIQNRDLLTKLKPMIKVHEVILSSTFHELLKKTAQNISLKKANELEAQKELGEKERKELDEKKKVLSAQIDMQSEQINEMFGSLEDQARESIDNIFKEALSKEEEDNPCFDICDIVSEEEETYSLDKKLEAILEKQFSREMFIPEDNSAEVVTEKGEKISKALEHYQKSRRKAEGLAFGSKSNTAFKIIQKVIYPLETQIRILKALLRYCPKEDQQAKES